MLIRKPYAFLIKNFRLIHGVLLALALYLGKESLDIYDFYSSYVSQHSYVPTGTLSAQYVNIWMYIICVLSFLVCLIIYYILYLKNKSRKLYFFSLLFYICLLVYFVVMAVSLKELQSAPFTVETTRVYRDVSLIFLLPQLVIIFFMFGRTIGFNIKQFEFKRDLEEMNIDVSDSEEVEVTFGSSSYKYMRGFRKFLRLSKYFFLENKLFVIILSSILVFSLSFYLFSKLNVYKDNNYEKAEFIANGLTYDITDCFITESDRNNKIINKGKYYLLVKAKISNKTTSKINVNRETFRLVVKDKLLYPDMALHDKFMDMGSVYKSRSIDSGLVYDCYVVFEIDKSELESEYVLKVLTNTAEGYKEKIVAPENLDEQHDNGSKAIPNMMDFSKSLLGKSTLTFSSYEIADKFMEKYTYDFDGEEKIGTYTVLPDKLSSGDNIIMKVDSTITIDEESNLSKYISIPADLYKYYGFISYRSMGESYETKIEPKDVIFEKSKLTYFEVPSNIKNADKIELILLVRGQKYTFILK